MRNCCSHLQHLYPEFEELGVDIAAVSADTRGKACSFVRANRAGTGAMGCVLRDPDGM